MRPATRSSSRSSRGRRPTSSSRRISTKDANLSVDIRPGFDLAAPLKGGRLATANVDAVPAGKYGKAALEKLGAWNGVKDKLAQAESVRAALVLVSRGEAPLGIVYQTDAAADPG